MKKQLIIQQQEGKVVLLTISVGTLTRTDIPSTIHVNFGLNVIHPNYGKDEVQLPDQVISLYAS